MVVLVALDDSIYSDLAFCSVQYRGWGEGTKFILLSVIEQLYFGVSGSVKTELAKDEEAWTARMHSVLDERVESLRKAHPNCSVEKRIEFGVPGEMILQVAEQVKPEEIIIGSHGRTGFSHYLLGSVAEQVASCTPCTLEIVKSPKLLQRTPESLPRDFDGLLKQEGILLVLTDTSDGRAAEKWVLESKWDTKQKISILTVCGSKQTKALTLIGNCSSEPQMLVHATEYHQSQVGKFKNLSTVVSDCIRIGDACDEILISRRIVAPI